MPSSYSPTTMNLGDGLMMTNSAAKAWLSKIQPANSALEYISHCPVWSIAERATALRTHANASLMVKPWQRIVILKALRVTSIWMMKTTRKNALQSTALLVPNFTLRDLQQCRSYRRQLRNGWMIRRETRTYSKNKMNRRQGSVVLLTRQKQKNS